MSILNGLPRVLVVILSIITLLLTAPTTSHAQEAAPDVPWASVLVQLDQPSASDVYLAQSAALQIAADSRMMTTAEANQLAAATQLQLANVTAAQDALSAQLDTIGAVEIYRLQRLYNGIAVRVPVALLPQLEALPGVTSVTPIVAKMPDNAISMPLIGAQELWGLPTALRGDGVTIGIIDTGVDYLHVGLGGPGTGYLENNVTIIGDVPGFPNPHVISGYDFAGDDYNASIGIAPYDPIPVPDPDPMDCYNHGTHVAATVAGNGVTTAGAAYNGPYDDSLDLSSLRVGPGVAPRATIYALKVFGCVGSSEIVDQGIEWAIDPNGDGDFSDHLDVINLSLGSPFGNPDDPTALAAERAAQLGVIVVASSGNTGDTWYALGSPGTAVSAITVGASTADVNSEVPDGSYTDMIATFSARGPSLDDNALKPDISAPGYRIVSALGGSGSGAITLSGTSMATPMVAGSLALLRQQYPAMRVEQLKALVMNTAVAAVRSQSDYLGPLIVPSRAGSGRINLADAIRATLLASNADQPGAVGLSFGAPQFEGNASWLRNVRISNLDSIPTTRYVEYLPITDVPGIDVLLPATPTITAAAAASVTFPVIVSANAATYQNVLDPAVSNTQVGLPRFWRSEEQGHLLLWDIGGRFTASLDGSAATPPNELGLTGTGIFTYTPATRNLAFAITATLDAADVTQITLERGISGYGLPQSAYTLTTNIAPTATVPFTGSVTLSPYDSRLLASGYLQVIVGTNSIPTGAVAGSLIAEIPVLKLPLFAAPRPISNMRAVSDTLEMGKGVTATTTLTLTGTPLTGTVFPTDTKSLVGAFEIHAHNPRVPGGDGFTRPAFADVRYVGVSTDYARVANKADARLYFAITTWGEWSTPNEALFSVLIDVDGDHITDYQVDTSDAASATSSGTSDAFLTVVYERDSGDLTAADPLNALSPLDQLTPVYQNNVVVLSVPAALLGLSSGKSAFDFQVQTTLRNPAPEEVGDFVSWMRYDMRRPGLWQSNMTAGTPWMPDTPATLLRFGFNLLNYTKSGAAGLLLLHLDNGESGRAEAVEVNYAWPYALQLPLVTQGVFGAAP